MNAQRLRGSMMAHVSKMEDGDMEDYVTFTRRIR